MTMRRKRLTAVLLCLAMCLTLSPAWAFAEDGTESAGLLPEETAAAAAADGDFTAETGSPTEAAAADAAAEEEAVTEESESLPEEARDEVGPAPSGETGEAPEAEEPEVPEAAEDEAADDETTAAETTEDTPEEEITEAVEAEEYLSAEAVTERDREALLNAYAQEQLDSLRPGAVEAQNWKELRGETLTGLNRKLYDALVPRIRAVAAGEQTSTTFVIPYEELGLKTEWTVAELGAENSEEALEMVRELFRCNSADLMQALLTDLPSELYWHDKTVSTQIAWAEKTSRLPSKIRVIGPGYKFQFPVAQEYSAGQYTVDASTGTAVSTALKNAAAVVEKYRGCSDYEKLLGYKDTICEMTDYNNYAATHSATPYGNPWQLIWVFDGNASTRVVCEGYAKAFVYLCDLTSFSAPIGTWTVTGTMTVSKSAGFHMWNIVSMENGKNYLVDVTNSDTTLGKENALFLTGSGEGSPAEGYSFLIGKTTVNYAYDADALAMFESELLTLSEATYLEDTTIEPEEPQQLSVPFDLRWGTDADGNAASGTVSFRAGARTGSRYRIDWYRDGSEAPAATDTVVTDGTETEGTRLASRYFAEHAAELEAGTYRFRVTALSDSETCQDSPAAESAVWTYAGTRVRLASPTGLDFSGAEPVWHFDGDQSLIGGMRALLYRADTEGGVQTRTEIIAAGSADETERQLCDWLRLLMEQSGEGWYAWELSLRTVDLNTVLDSELSERSPLRFVSAEEIEELRAWSEDFRLTLNCSYLLLEQGRTSERLTANLSETAMKRLVWTVEDASGAETENGTGDAVIRVEEGTVSALRAGTAYAVATYTRDGTDYRARCRVDVIPDGEELQEVTAGLSEDRVTVEMYRTDYTRVGIVLTLKQNRVTAAEIGTPEVEQSSNEAEVPAEAIRDVTWRAADKNDITGVFELRRIDDRYAEIVPKNLSEAAVKEVKSSYKALITVTLTNGRVFEDLPLTVAVKKTTPSLKAAAVKLNSFIPGDSAPLAVTGGTVQEIVRYTQPACIRLDPETLTLTQNGTGRGTLTATCRLENWAGTWPLKVNVTCAEKKPTLKLSASSVTLKPGMDDVAVSRLTVTPADYAGGAYTFRAEAVDGSDRWLSLDMKADGTLNVSLKPGIDEDSLKGKNLKANAVLSLGSKKISVPLTVKILADSQKITVTARAVGAIDTAVPGSPITLTAQVKNYNATGDELELVLYRTAGGVTKAMSVAERDSLFSVDQNGTVFTLTAEDRAALKQELDQKHSFSAAFGIAVGSGFPEESRPVKLSIKASKSAPAVTVNYRTSGSIDILRPETSVTVTPTVKNWYQRPLGAGDLHVYDSAYRDITDRFTVEFDSGSGSYTLKVKGPDAGLNPRTRTYVAIPASITGAAKENYGAIGVKMGPAKISQSTKEISLSKNDVYDRKSVILSLSDPSLPDIGEAEAELSDRSGFFRLTPLGGGEYAIGYAKEQIQKNPQGFAKLKSANVQLKVFLSGNRTTVPNATLSLKISLK